MKTNKFFFGFKSNILGFVMVMFAILFLVSLGNMVESFNWLQPVIMIVSALIVWRLNKTKVMQKWNRLPVEDHKL